MSLEDARTAIRSTASPVTIEAPAGCGKTFEAASGAIDLAAKLQSGQEILLLAHTNVAVQEFRRRIAARRARVRAVTIDAFALELVKPYAGALGLPTPLRVDGEGAVPFVDLAPRLLELFERAPAVASAVAGHYPYVLLDEHQDARLDQHRIALKLESTGRSKLRFFGDPMQGIYEFGGEQLLDWSDLRDDSATIERLDDPRRWEDTPRLGDWIMSARHALETGAQVTTSGSPPEVEVMPLDALEEPQNPYSNRVPPGLAGPLHRVLNRLTGSVAVLARTNAHALGMRRASKGRIPVQEGADLTLAYEALERAREVDGDPRELSRLVVWLLSRTSTGFTQALRERVNRRLLADRIELGNARSLRPFLDELARLYERPTLETWCRLVGTIARDPPSGVRVDLPESLRALGRLGPTEGEDPRRGLDRVLMARRAGAFVPRLCSSTIHKAKGQQFDHVVLAQCGAKSFPDQPETRRLLYVAISRARRSLTILVPGRSPSPLLSLG